MTRKHPIIMVCYFCKNTFERHGKKSGLFCSRKCARQCRYWKNHTKELRRMKKWRKENPQKFKDSKNKHYRANRTKILLSHKDWQLRTDYNITLEQYDAECAKRENRCDICYKVCPNRTLRPDHCHKTGKWRGLLCDSCNNGLGRFKDDPQILLAAACYLDPHITT